ncbi:MAG: MFS transporter [Verrucomicrobiota bacterium]
MAKPSAALTQTTQAVSRQELFGWCCFDFANSAFTTIIITVVYAPFFINEVCQKLDYGNLLWAVALSISQVLVILLAPFLGAVADVTARKKVFLIISALICSIFTCLLGSAHVGSVVWAMGILIIANLAYSLGENFCASFLPEISTPENVGRISGYGWSFGYCGGLLSLIIGIVILSYNEGQETHVVPWLCIMTGLFFATAALPAFLFLKERKEPLPNVRLKSLWRQSWKLVLDTVQHLRRKDERRLFGFFMSFGCYMCGLAAIFAFAAEFARNTLGFTTKENLILFASLQISSALGAFGFGFLQDKVGAKSVLIFSLICWLVVCIGGSLCQEKWHFFLVGNLAGLVIGSTQAGSRAVVSILTPSGKEGQIFGFWGLFAKAAAIIGYLSMGASADVFGFKVAILLNGIFFLAGLFILFPLKLNPH